MGEVILCGGAVLDPRTHNLCQIADVDSGVTRWANVDLVTHIFPLAGSVIIAHKSMLFIIVHPSKLL